MHTSHVIPWHTCTCSWRSWASSKYANYGNRFYVDIGHGLMLTIGQWIISSDNFRMSGHVTDRWTLSACLSLSKHKTHSYATVQMVCLVPSKQSRMFAPAQIPPGAFFSNFFFSLPVTLREVVYMYNNFQKYSTSIINGVFLNNNNYDCPNF